jgi:ribosome biogenesis ATPase
MLYVNKFYRIYKDLYKSKEEEKLPQVITAEENKQLDKEVQTCSENSENPDDINVTMEVTNTANETPILLKDIVQSPENAEMDVIQTHSSDSLTPNLLTLLHNKSPLSLEQLSVLYIEQSDFEAVLRIVQPSAKREGFATVPDVTWDDVGSLQDIRQELQMMILVSRYLSI